MSWDGMIFRAPSQVAVEDLPDDFQMEPLGSTDDIRHVLASLFPNAEHRDGQTQIRSDEFWLELNYSKPSGVIDHLGVRTNAGRGVTELLRIICDAFQARLLDSQTSEFADFDAETVGSMQAFTEWRDRVMAKYESNSN